MEIVDLTEKHLPLYLVCLEDWNDEMKEAGNHKALWYDKMKDNGLRVKLALDDRGEVGGMIQYVPIEHSQAQGQGLYFVHCIWVHGYKQGRGNFRKLGMGKALLRAAEDDARALGASGTAAWGLILPVWMKASWFRKHGYKNAERIGLQQLVWKPFSPTAVRPRWIHEAKRPKAFPGVVTVTAFLTGWCPAQNIAFERARRAAAEFGNAVVFDHVDTTNNQTFQEWGMRDALFIDGKQVRTGPPPSYEKIRKIIANRVKKL